MRGNTAEIGREPKTEEVAEESKDNEGLQDHLTREIYNKQRSDPDFL